MLKITNPMEIIEAKNTYNKLRDIPLGTFDEVEYGEWTKTYYFFNEDKVVGSVLSERLYPSYILRHRNIADDIDRILDANEIYAILTDGFGHDVTASLKISRVRSRGVQLEQNQYGVHYALFDDYKKSWALTRKELE